MVTRKSNQPGVMFWLITLVICALWPPAVIGWAIGATIAFCTAFKRAERQVLAEREQSRG